MRSAGALVLLDMHHGYNNRHFLLFVCWSVRAACCRTLGHLEILTRFNHVNHTVPHFLDRFLKVAQAGFLVPVATVQLGVFVDETGVDDL